MPSPAPTLTIASALRSIGERSFPTQSRRNVGVELEWFTTPSDDPPHVDDLARMLDGTALPWSSAITFEPGAQVELSSRPFPSCSQACRALEADRRVVASALAVHGIGLFEAAVDVERTHELKTDVPRYVAMREFFDTGGPAGGRMMCTSAAIHVNLDAGRDDEGMARWRSAHLVGPVLVAMFANSPFNELGSTGWKSSRIQAWRTIDPTRTHPVPFDGDPAEAWAAYALDARVMFIRTGATYVPLEEPTTFRRWIADGHELGYPTDDDLDYHLTTLFPPVRPHGHLELRMIDMLPSPWWRAAAAITTALVYDEEARQVAAEACASLGDVWERAARAGLDDDDVRAAAQACAGAAIAALGRIECDDRTEHVSREFVERFTAEGRSPADDLTDAYLVTEAM